MTEADGVELLLVEDHPQDLELVLRALRKAGVASQVLVARDGSEALEYVFCEGPHAARRITDAPKFILLDLKLPKVDGLEVLKRIKADPRTRTIPVVVLTSSREPSDIEASYLLGANCFVVKPMNFERFSEAVRGIVHFWLLLNQAPTMAG
jgi:CheY-like chemotaxis protein